MSGASVLVFGATGQVGGAVAQEAAERGSKVWLATRDPSKPIKWLSKQKEDDGTFTRIKADLSDNASLAEAVKKSGAKSAFVYLVQGMRSKSAFQALKDAGITWISLLSSFSVSGDLTKYKPESMIPYHHAEGELDLQAVGIAYGAVRPGYFASNIQMFVGSDIKEKGEVFLYLAEETKYDYIAPENIGQVAGALLTSPKPDLKPTDPEIVYLYGPKFESLSSAAKKYGKVLGKDIKVNSLSADDYRKYLTGKGMPEIFANYLINQGDLVVYENFYETQAPGDQSGNIQKYSGKKPISYDEWLEMHKDEITA